MRNGRHTHQDLPALSDVSYNSGLCCHSSLVSHLHVTYDTHLTGYYTTLAYHR